MGWGGAGEGIGGLGRMEAEVICPSPALPLVLLWAEIMVTSLLLLLEPQK